MKIQTLNKTLIINVLMLFLASTAILSCVSCGKSSHDGENSNKTVEFSPDMTSLIRNPAMGWVLYDDACGEVSNADKYWKDMESIPDDYASIFYWRSRWSELEPEEGRYAWIYDENFKSITKQALDKGLKLAFRIYTDSQDNVHQSTPDYVRQAGAQGYINSHWTPYADDPVFQEKFEKFLKAFAEEFDDPQKVDFIDAYTLGWWGECHHVEYMKKGNELNSYLWQIRAFANAFKKVLLVDNLGASIAKEYQINYGLNQYGLIWRRDGLGSMWFTDEEINSLKRTFPGTAFIGESCYWGGGPSDQYQTWDSDTKYDFNTWVDVYKATYTDALNNHANCLDLRQRTEAHSWIKRAPELVDGFKIKGGYRFTPVKISYQPATGNSIKISHEWQNNGVGVCPNNNVRWNYKYKVAFALLDCNHEIVSVFVDEKAEPSQWIKGKNTTYSTTAEFDAPEGTYDLCVSIVDTSLDNVPGLNLAVLNGEYFNGWLSIGEVQIK